MREPSSAEDATLLARGHPRVSRVETMSSVVYEIRAGNPFGWLWLAFSVAFFTAMFFALAAGKVRFNGTLVPHPGLLHYLALACLSIPFLLIGLVLSTLRYKVISDDTCVTVRLRIGLVLGWTWTLPAGEGLRVFLAHKGITEFNRPVASVVLVSGSTQVDFGASLPEDAKRYLVASLNRDYGGH